MDFPSPCPASEIPSASAPPRLRDTCDGSPSAERGEGDGVGGKERGGVKEGKGRREGRIKRGRRTRVRPDLLQSAVDLCKLIRTTECCNILLSRL